MTTGDADKQHELTDDQLDMLLNSTDDKLLNHIQTVVDPSTTLRAIMDLTATTEGDPPHGAAPDASHVGTEPFQDHAVLVITQRSALARALASASLLLEALEEMLPGRATANVSARLASAHLTSDLARELARDLKRARIDVWDITDTFDLVADIAHAHDLAETLSHALTDNIHTLIDRPDSGFRLRGHDASLASELVYVLDQVLRDARWGTVDVSAADLSHVMINMEAVRGVVWSDETVWPAGLADHVRDASHEISPGRYQVRGGTERDPSELSWR